MKLFENSFPSSARLDNDGFEIPTKKDERFAADTFATPMQQPGGVSRNLFDDMPLPTTQVKAKLLFHSYDNEIST